MFEPSFVIRFKRYISEQHYCCEAYTADKVGYYYKFQFPNKKEVSIFQSQLSTDGLYKLSVNVDIACLLKVVNYRCKEYYFVGNNAYLTGIDERDITSILGIVKEI